MVMKIIDKLVLMTRADFTAFHNAISLYYKGINSVNVIEKSIILTFCYLVLIALGTFPDAVLAAVIVNIAVTYIILLATKNVGTLSSDIKIAFNNLKHINTYIKNSLDDTYVVIDYHNQPEYGEDYDVNFIDESLRDEYNAALENNPYLQKEEPEIKGFNPFEDETISGYNNSEYDNSGYDNSGYTNSRYDSYNQFNKTYQQQQQYQKPQQPYQQQYQQPNQQRHENQAPFNQFEESQMQVITSREDMVNSVVNQKLYKDGM